MFSLTSSPNVLDHDQARILLQQFDEILVELTAYPENSRRDLLQNFQSLISYVLPKEDKIECTVELLHEFVERNARKIPERTALQYYTSISPNTRSKCWTYQELNSLGNKVAHLILAHTRPKSLVAICFDKCPEAYFTILGILKAGCAFVAIDPAAPKARKKFILNDAEVSLMLGSEDTITDISEDIDIKLVNMTRIDFASLSHGPLNAGLIEGSDICYCLYTSGSTGTAKGCEITHENTVQAMAAFHRLFAEHWDKDSRWLQFASFHFDVSVLEQFWSWSAGICVVSAGKYDILQDLTCSIQRMNITHVDLTPSLAQTLDPKNVPSLTKGVFIVGGESLKQGIIDTWGPYKVIYNGYGPTEATIGVTMLPRVTKDDKSSNIGPQFDNVGSFVVYPDTECFVPQGGIGELCIFGRLVGKGYRNRPELTAERFPSHSKLGFRYYRTGDLVRMLSDESFEFIGRSDSQVKLRGQRLELGEIDHVIRSSDVKVKDVSTNLLKHPKTGKDMIVSFVVLSKTRNVVVNATESTKDQVDAIRKSCSLRLQPYMIPTQIVSVSAIALTANNKVDKRKLESIFEITLSAIQDSVAESSYEVKYESAAYKKIVTAASQVLRTSLENVPSSANIFNLGIDSVSVIKFVKILRENGVESAQVGTVMQRMYFYQFMCRLC